MTNFIIWALILLSCAPVWAQSYPNPHAPTEPGDMKPLFDGLSLDGWDGDSRLWSVRNGVIRGETTPEKATEQNTFLISKEEVGDFELRLSFRIEKGNSGIQYRSRRLPDIGTNRWSVGGYQAEVENTNGIAGFLYHERGREYLCRVGDIVTVREDGKTFVVGALGDRNIIGATYKKGDWNEYIIIARGNHLQHYLNNIQTVDLVDNDPKGRMLHGLIALQIHAGRPMWVEFKDIRLKKYNVSQPE